MRFETHKGWLWGTLVALVLASSAMFYPFGFKGKQVYPSQSSTSSVLGKRVEYPSYIVTCIQESLVGKCNMFQVDEYTHKLGIKIQIGKRMLSRESNNPDFYKIERDMLSQ